MAAGLGLLLLAAGAGAASSPVAVDVTLAEAPACVVRAAPVCVVGHEDQGTGTLGDDVVHVTTVVVDAEVTLPPLPVGGPVAVSADRKETYVDHPAFVAAETVVDLANGSLPEPLQPIVRLRHGTTSGGSKGIWINAFPYRLVPVPGMDEDRPVAVPVFFYQDGVFERERLYPLALLGGNPVGTDDWLDIGRFVATACLAEEEALVPAVCAARRAAANASLDLVYEATPDVRTQTGLHHATVGARGEATAGGVLGTSSGGSSASPAEPAAAARTLEEGSPAWGGSEALPWTEPRRATAAPAPSPGPARSAWDSLGAPPRSDLALLAAVAASLLVLAVALYRRLRRSDLLRHPARKALLELVKQQPGITIGEAARALGLSYKTAQHHVDLLVEDAYLLAQPRGRWRCLFDGRSHSLQERQALLVAQRPSAARILRLLEELGPLPRSEVPQRAGLGRTAAWQGLRDLEDAGLVRTDRGVYPPVVWPAIVAARPRVRAAAPAAGANLGGTLPDLGP